MNNPRVQLGIVGNPDNRRVRDFSACWQALGQARPILLDYRALPSQAPAVDYLRLDSPGESPDLAQQLIHRGGAPAGSMLAHGEVAYLRAYHQGYCQLLRHIAAWRLPAMNSADEIAQMFDKWACHERFAAKALSRPTARLAPASYELWQQQRPPQGRVFLKPLHGSSSSGVCALRWNRTHQQLQCPLSIDGGRLYNSLRVRRYETWEQIEHILSRLLPQGMIEEYWVPKLNLALGALDLRILVIQGEARHTVLRQSQSPMTNLHLGNRRGDLAELDASLGHALPAARALAEQAAACFQNCLYAGVDILLDQNGRPYIGEINAFGDLLPGLLDRGEDTYTAIARASLRCKAEGGVRAATSN